MMEICVVIDLLTKILPVSLGYVLYPSRGEAVLLSGTHSNSCMFCFCTFIFADRVAENKCNNDHTVWKLVKQTWKLFKLGGFTISGR